MKTPQTRHSHRIFAMRKAFSMMELVFVIIILGILAAIALPRLSLTRSDAQLIAVENDIISTLNALQREVFSQNIAPNSIDGAKILELAGLSTSRWIAQNNGIKLAKNGSVDMENDCVSLMQENGKLILSIQVKPDSPLCEKLLKRHPTRKEIPLSTSNAIF